MQTRRKFLAGLAAMVGAIVAAPVVVASGSATPDDYKAAGEALNALPGPTLQVGDVFEIAGRESVNPVTGRSTGHLQRFVVTETATVEALADRVDPPMYPRMIDAGPYRNISSARPFTSSDVRLISWGPAPVARQGLAFHRDAFAVAVRPL